MTLSQYLSEKGLTYEAFGALIGVGAPAVSRYVTGARYPRRAVLLRILAATDGAVTPADLLCAPKAEGEAA